MKKKKRMNWNEILDLLMLVIFGILAIYLLIAMCIRGLSLFELFLMFISISLADGSLSNVIEE